MDGVDASDLASMPQWKDAATVGWECKPTVEDNALSIELPQLLEVGWERERRWRLSTTTRTSSVSLCPPHKLTCVRTHWVERGNASDEEQGGNLWEGNREHGGL